MATLQKRGPYQLNGLVLELCKQPAETEWLEFKHNNADPQEIGEYLSALSNSRALCGEANAYLVWGIENDTHKVVGVTFSPDKKKVGEEELENWLLKLITPKIDFHFHCFEGEDLPVVLLEIGRAFRHPVQFQSQEFIRVGSYKKKLKDFPEREENFGEYLIG